MLRRPVSSGVRSAGRGAVRDAAGTPRAGLLVTCAADPDQVAMAMRRRFRKSIDTRSLLPQVILLCKPAARYQILARCRRRTPGQPRGARALVHCTVAPRPCGRRPPRLRAPGKCSVTMTRPGSLAPSPSPACVGRNGLRSISVVPLVTHWATASPMPGECLNPWATSGASSDSALEEIDPPRGSPGGPWRDRSARGCDRRGGVSSIRAQGSRPGQRWRQLANAIGHRPLRSRCSGPAASPCDIPQPFTA